MRGSLSRSMTASVPGRGAIAGAPPSFLIGEDPRPPGRSAGPATPVWSLRRRFAALAAVARPPQGVGFAHRLPVFPGRCGDVLHSPASI